MAFTPDSFFVLSRWKLLSFGLRKFYLIIYEFLIPTRVLLLLLLRQHYTQKEKDALSCRTYGYCSSISITNLYICIDGL